MELEVNRVMINQSALTVIVWKVMEILFKDNMVERVQFLQTRDVYYISPIPVDV